MDKKVIGIALVVVALGLYIKGVPQHLWSLIKGGQRDTLTSVLSSASGDGTPQSPGAVVAGQANGVLPGMAVNNSANGDTAPPSSIAALVALHIQALAHPGVDPALDHLNAILPITNDPQLGTWKGAFRSCYSGGDTVGTCAARASSQVGWSPFG